MQVGANASSLRSLRTLRILRSLRVLRVLKVRGQTKIQLCLVCLCCRLAAQCATSQMQSPLQAFRYLQSLRVIVDVLMSSMGSFLAITCLMVLFIFCFAVIGLQVGKLPLHFFPSTRCAGSTFLAYAAYHSHRSMSCCRPLGNTTYRLTFPTSTTCGMRQSWSSRH